MRSYSTVSRTFQAQGLYVATLKVLVPPVHLRLLVEWPQESDFYRTFGIVGLWVSVFQGFLADEGFGAEVGSFVVIPLELR